MDKPDILEFAKQIFSAQPYTQYLAAELTDLTEERTVIQLELRKELQQQHGFAHGGVLSYLADNAITFAGGVALQGDALTSEFKINYLKPAKGPLLRAEAVALSVSGRQAVCQCHIISVNAEEETLCAIAQGTAVRFSKDKK